MSVETLLLWLSFCASIRRQIVYAASTPCFHPVIDTKIPLSPNSPHNADYTAFQSCIELFQPGRLSLAQPVTYYVINFPTSIPAFLPNTAPAVKPLPPG